MRDVWIAGADMTRVGRLDLDTSGLLSLTNDTAFAERLTNPEYKVRVTLESNEAEYLEAALRDLLARLPAEAVIRVQ